MSFLQNGILYMPFLFSRYIPDLFKNKNKAANSMPFLSISNFKLLNLNLF